MRRSLTMLLLAAVACTGGSRSGQTAGPEVVRGVTTAVGSVTVLGTEFDTSDAELDPDTLVPAPGMKVTLEGVRDPGGETGSASRVVYRPDLRGPVEADPIVSGPERKELSILGQTVVIDRADTVFDGGVDFDSVAKDDVLEVSGLRDGYDAVLATRVVVPTTSGVWLRGAVASLDTPGGTFEISGVEVDFDGTTDLSGVPGGALADGDFVDVSGVFTATAPDVVAASAIAVDAPALQGSQGIVRIEGLVSELRSLGDFLVGGQPVFAANLGVRFDPDASIVTEGAYLEVEGSLDNGVVVARQVTRRSPDVRIEAEIAETADVDLAARTLQLLGDIGVDVLPSARLVGIASLADLGAGNFVGVRGVAIGGRVRATRVELLAASGSGKTVQLRGPVSEFDSANGTFTILGLQIPLVPGTVYEAFPHNPTLDGRGDLFAFLGLGGASLHVVDEDDDSDATTLDGAGRVGPERSIPVVIAAEVADGAVDGAASRLTLLGGIVVKATFATGFGSCDAIQAFNEVKDLVAGDVVEVRGARRFGGIVRAVSIQCFDAPRDVRLRGRVEATDGSSEFTILGTVVPTGLSTQFESFPGVTSESDFYAFLSGHPTAVIDVVDQHDGDDTMIDVADTVTLSDYGD